MSTGETETDSRWPADWFTGRRVLVTGGTSGIGAGVARAFLRAGGMVTATGVTQAEIDALAGDTDLGSALVELLDVRDDQAVKALVSRLPALDIVVNCAGIIRRGEELDPKIFDQVVDINLGGTMRVCAAARPLLARSGQGAIVNLASMLSFFGGGLVPGYAASKGGISQLTKSLAIAYAGDNIRVNAVAPGWIETPLTTALREDAGRSDAILARTPLKRWGKPADVAGAVLFLCSPVASFITGSTLVVDGGYSIT
ncbi:SDR family NAD(P)-dependent oxidoreductase [Mesorhizobium sp. LHD-90]|uniref:SDR family NAD(P)-dependent oxidoreductase n=1 Tax=Mesorhizobium sp. LHD-90 TaxID=3071414 RepID=UPI0027E0DEFC|nr:SDR family NAD(P)-dependent oxidoreductase [Mesorhizobium sp. LHD-90]MDQ6433851.1 SDR family NAD(P)-dependent oxidoreductase [Mesorhizobium sp. LHD-90]